MDVAVELHTVADVDTALNADRAVPEDERTGLWSVIVDALLERRAELEG